MSNFEYSIEGVEPADLGEAVRMMQFLGECGFPVRVIVVPGQLTGQDWLNFFNQHLNVSHFAELPDGRCMFTFYAAARTLH